MNLFNTKLTDEQQPLAYRMRPRTLDEVLGQDGLIGKASPLRRAIENDCLHSFILFGPSGTGKTTIARLVAQKTDAYFVRLQAVTTGVNDIRKIASDAADRLKYYQQKTVLFVDEIHRFNKGQQDVLLPFIEDGTLILIGATTENPLFELNNALLSRIKLYMLEELNDEAIRQIVKNAVNDPERGLGKIKININDGALDLITQHAKGDARIALNIIETAVNHYYSENQIVSLDEAKISTVAGKPLLKYDRSGDSHYDTASAFIKSIRGSDVDAALFWLAVMLEGGEDPRFIARRLVILAAEDIGMADPFALHLAVSTAQAVEFVGLPEARFPLSEATIFLASAPKSNSSKTAIDMAIATVRQSKQIKVPSHIASAGHSKAGTLLGKGQGYKYPHDYGGYVEQTYLPEELAHIKLYNPDTSEDNRHK